MRVGFMLPTCVLVSAIVHVVLLTAVAVPRQSVTTHGATMTVDLVPSAEVPDIGTPDAEAAPAPPDQPPAIPPLPQPQAAIPDTAAQSPARPPPSAAQRDVSAPVQQQRSAQQQPQQHPPEPPQPREAPQTQSPPQAVEPPHPPEKPTPDVSSAQSQDSLAAQAERLSAMLNLPGPGNGDGTGAEADTKARLTTDEVAAFRAHLKSCWKLPPGINATQRLKLIVRLSLRPNGALSAEPALIEAVASPLGPTLLREAMRAIKQCEPYTMLPGEKYREWRVLDIDFSPDQMARG